MTGVQTLLSDLFLQIGDDDLLQLYVEGQHKVLHQVVGEGAAGLYMLQHHRNGLRFKPSNHYGNSPYTVHFSQNHRIRMRIGNAVAESNYFQLNFGHTAAKIRVKRLGKSRKQVAAQ